MELIEFNQKDLTLKMSRAEFRALCDLSRAVSTEYNALDREILMMEEDEVIDLRDRLFSILDEGLLLNGVDAKKMLEKVKGLSDE